MAVVLKVEKKTNKEKEEEEPQLILVLSDEIAELCLLHVPYTYQFLARSVSSSWNKAITNPSFFKSKENHLSHSFSLSRPFLFVLTLQAQHRRLQWHALALSSGSWFTLPAVMPVPADDISLAWRVALASKPKQGKLRVVIASTSNTATTLSYHTITNKWSLPSVTNKAEHGTEICDMEGQTWGVEATTQKAYEEVAAVGVWSW